MRRALRLLKACKELKNTSTAVISQVSFLATLVVGLICFISILGGILLGRQELVSSYVNISYLNVIMQLLTLRSIYSGFIEDKRKGTKNNFRALITHLPISKKDFVLAQYIGNISVFMPAFIVLMILIISSCMTQDRLYQFEVGAVTLGVCFSYCFIVAEKGILSYYYVDPRIREISYVVLMALWLGFNYVVEEQEGNVMLQIISEKQDSWWFDFICYFASFWGIVLMFILIVISYIGYMKGLMMLEGGHNR